MALHFSKGDKVTWTWGAHEAHGQIAERFARRVQRTLEGETIVRNGSPDAPAYPVTQTDGGLALKAQSELHPSRSA